MKVGLGRTSERSKKLATEKDNEDVSDRKKTNSALNQVNLLTYIDGGVELEKEESAKLINETLNQLRPGDLNARNETLLLWETCIVNVTTRFPLAPTREKPQDFSNTKNNVNKFFGNKFGNNLRTYVNNLGIYFAGENMLLS